jgi:hypothetical protein
VSSPQNARKLLHLHLHDNCDSYHEENLNFVNWHLLGSALPDNKYNSVDGRMVSFKKKVVPHPFADVCCVTIIIFPDLGFSTEHS